MEQAIYAKYKKFEDEYDLFLQKLILSRRIVTKMTDAVFNHELRKEVEMKTKNELKVFLETIFSDLDVFTNLLEAYNKITDTGFAQLVSIEDELTLFLHKECDLSQYKENIAGECLVTEVDDHLNGKCYINDSRKFKIPLHDFCGERLTEFPKSGEIFAVSWENQELLRAVRSDLLFKEPKQLLVHFLDTGKTTKIPYNLDNFYSVPKEICDIEPYALPCKVVELVDGNGLSLDIQNNLQSAVNQTAFFEIKKVKSNFLHIKLWLKDEHYSRIDVTNEELGDLRTAMQDKQHGNVVENVGAEFPSDKLTAIESVFPCSEAKCKFCGKVFIQFKELRLHIRSHVGKKSRKCRFCGEIYKRGRPLRSHINKMHTELHICEICGKDYLGEVNLRQHVETHFQ